MSYVLVILIAFLVGMEGILDEFQFHQPIVACSLIGWACGYPGEGIVLGGTLQMITLGWANVGAAVAPDAALSSVTSAILMMKLLEHTTAVYVPMYLSILVAVPVSLVGLYLTKYCRNVAIGFVHNMDDATQMADIPEVEKWHLLGIGMQGLRVVVVAVVLLLIPSKLLFGIYSALPAWVWDGAVVGGGMITAVGYAIVVNMMSGAQTWPFFILGFFFASSNEFSLGALVAMGVAFALVFMMLKYRGGSAESKDSLDEILNDY